MSPYKNSKILSSFVLIMLSLVSRSFITILIDAIAKAENSIILGWSLTKESILLAPSEFIKFTSRCLLSVMSLSNSDILFGNVKVYALSSIISGNCRINGSTILIISFLPMSSFSYLVLSMDISIGFISIELFIFCLLLGKYTIQNK